MTATTERSLPPVARLMMLTDGLRRLAAVHTLVELGIPDLLTEEGESAEALAGFLGADADALYRVLRAGAQVGVVDESTQARFTPNELTRHLSRHRPDSSAHLIRMFGGTIGLQSYAGLTDTVRTGLPAYVQSHGRSVWESASADPEVGGVVDGSMTQLAAWSRIFFSELELPDEARVVDVGGGQGLLLATLLQRNPTAHGVLYDRPEAVAASGPVLAAHGVEDRVTRIGGDFGDDGLPGDGDVYLLKSILHLMPDDEAVRTLEWVRERVAGRQASVRVLEWVLAPPGTADQAKLLDLDMLVLYGGKDRTLQEWDAIIGAAGLVRVNAPAVGGWAELACVPRGW